MATFRKSKTIGGIRFNFSKSGIGFSTGIKGLRIGVDSKGKAYRSVGVPGTGIYSKKNLNSSKKSSYSQQNENFEFEDLLGFDYPVELYRESDNKGCLNIFIWVISIILIPFIIGIFTTIGLIIYKSNEKKKPKNIFRKNFLDGVMNARIGKFNLALKKLAIANKIEPENRYLIDLIGVCFFKLENYEKALKYFIKLVKIEKGERVNVLLAQTYMKIDDPEFYPEIIKLNIEYLEAHPADTETLFMTGYYLHSIKNNDAAISYLQQISEDDELYLPSLNLTSACFFEKKEYDNAIQVLQKAPLRKQRLDDDLKSIHYLLGCIYQEKGETKNALKHLKKVMIEDINYEDIKDRIKELNKE